ncbi:hypothetical protein T484DRAFT_1916880, partial [Baffinella frigidus]
GGGGGGGVKTCGVDVFQVTSSGPAALVPPVLHLHKTIKNVSLVLHLHKLIKAADFHRALATVRRPPLVLIPREDDDTGGEQLLDFLAFLQSSSSIGLCHLRTVETPAAVQNSIITFRGTDEEVLALVPPGAFAASEFSTFKVDVDDASPHLFAIFVAPFEE